MNGRIYDPSLGRFLQADPHIQAPKNSQSFNRYSYVLNNPLSYSDPSGYFFKSLFKKLNKVLGDFAPLLGIALLAIPVIREWTLASGWNAALFGFGTGGVATGSLKGALIGAFSGAVFHHIGGAFTEGAGGFFEAGGLGHIGTHAFTGGVISVLSGGKFGHGFLSAGLTKAANINSLMSKSGGGWDIARIAAAAVVGGTISKITGGKFSNGASTAAFAQAFNGNQALKRAAKKLKNLRRQAVVKAWKDEIKLVQETGQGTREWTEAELEILKSGKVPVGFHGHHINSVKGSPELAGDPNNIEFLTPEEHFARHGNNWRNPTVGSLMDRTFSITLGIGVSVLEVMDAYSLEGIMAGSARAGCAAGDMTMCQHFQMMGGEVYDANAI